MFKSFSKTGFLAVLPMFLFSVMILSGCSSSSNSGSVIDALQNSQTGKSVCDGMVYDVSFPDEVPFLKEAARDGRASFWFEESSGGKHVLGQIQHPGEGTLLRIEGDLPAGTYKLMMSVDGQEDLFLLDPVVDINSPASIGYEGDAVPGGTITVSGYFMGKRPQVWLDYKTAESGDYTSIECSVLDGPGEYDDPYDESSEKYPMEVTTGTGELSVKLPDTGAPWYSARLIIISDNGFSILSLGNSENGAPDSGESSGLVSSEDADNRGQVISVSKKCELKASSFQGRHGYTDGQAYDYLIAAIKENFFKVHKYVAGISLYRSSKLKKPSDYDYCTALYNVEYRTQDEAGKPIIASGVIIMPSSLGGLKKAPLLSFQHGTMLKKSEAPSMSSSPELAMAACFSAMDGYITVVPDHPGLGMAAMKDADYYHPYCQAKPIAYADADMIKAVPEIIEWIECPSAIMRNVMKYAWSSISRPSVDNPCARPDGRVFLTGYSEGGYATMALLRELTQNPEKYGISSVTAVASQSGPYSLSDVMLKRLMSKTEKFPVFYFAPYLAVTMNNYKHLYAQPGDYLAPNKLELVNYINGNFKGDDVDEIFKPESGLPREAFSENLRNELDAQTGSFYEALKENDLVSGWSWDSSTKVALVHGTTDDCVLWNNSYRMKQNHPEAELIDVYEDFSILGMVQPTHVLYFTFCMGEASVWLRDRLKETN